MSGTISRIAQDDRRPAETVNREVDEERRDVLRRVVALLVAGRPGRAEYELARGVARQARIAGIGAVVIEACPRCGISCGHRGVR